MSGRTHLAFGALAGAAGLPQLAPALGVELDRAQLLAGVCIATFAGIVADCDHPDSLITHGVLPGRGALGRLARVLGWWLSIPPRLLGLCLRQVASHRGPTHSLLFAFAWALAAAPIYVVQLGLSASLAASLAAPLLDMLGFAVDPNQGLGLVKGAAVSWAFKHMGLIALATFLGYLSHLIADSLNTVPIPWPWPFKLGPNRGRWFLLPRGLRVRVDSEMDKILLRYGALIGAGCLLLMALFGSPDGAAPSRPGDVVVALALALSSSS